MCSSGINNTTMHKNAIRGVNADLSLKKSSRIGLQQLVVHWNTSNLHLQGCRSHYLPVSSPIQRPEPSWSKKQIMLDHIYTNAVTPMIFLMMKQVTYPLSSNHLTYKCHTQPYFK